MPDSATVTFPNCEKETAEDAGTAMGHILSPVKRFQYDHIRLAYAYDGKP